ALIDGQPAQVFGLIGIDAIHGVGGKSELHPVLGMAIKEKTGPDREYWAVFARRDGNEGGCGPNVMDSGLTEMRFMLPPPINPILTTRLFSAAVSLDTTSYPGAMLLTIPLPPPGGLVWGQVFVYQELPPPPTCPDGYTDCCGGGQLCSMDCSTITCP